MTCPDTDLYKVIEGSNNSGEKLIINIAIISTMKINSIFASKYLKCIKLLSFYHACFLNVSVF